jgi:hypothetical protein
VATFSVHASWISESEVAEDSVLKINQTFRPDDEALCTWVDEAEPRRFLVSFNVESDSYATAARECFVVVAAVRQIDPRLGTLEEVGATDDGGYLVVRAEDFGELQHLTH